MSLAEVQELAKGLVGLDMDTACQVRHTAAAGRVPSTWMAFTLIRVAAWEVP